MNSVTILVGGRGTGKTDYVKSLMRVSPLKKQLIVDTFDNPRWANMESWDNPDGQFEQIGKMQLENLPYWNSGRYLLFGSNRKEIFHSVSENVTDTFVTFEDATKYINYRKPLDDFVRETVLDTKQKNVNMILCFHSLRTVHAELADYVDYFVIKKNGQNPKLPYHIKQKFSPEIIDAHDEVWADKSRFATIALDIRA